jgi:hypothetical protein
MRESDADQSIARMHAEASKEVSVILDLFHLRDNPVVDLTLLAAVGALDVATTFAAFIIGQAHPLG